MTTLADHQYWPLERLGEAIDLLLTAGVRSNFQGTGGETSDRVFRKNTRINTDANDHRADVSEPIETAVQRATAAQGVTTTALSSEYDHLPHCLSGASPLIVPVRHGRGALLILKATTRHATVLTTHGRQQRLPIAQVLAELHAPLPTEVVRSIDALRNRLGDATAATLEAEHLKHRPIFVGWKLTPRKEEAVFARNLALPLAGRMLALLLVHFAQFGLWILSWLTLANALFGAGERTPLLVLWGLALVSSMLVLPIETWLSQDVATRAGVAVKRLLLNRALEMDKSAVRKLGIGALIARALDANTLDSLAARGGIRVLLTIFDVLFVAVLFYSYLGPHPLFVLFVAVALLAAGQCRAYYRAELNLHAAHLEVTALHTEEMIGHRTRKIFIGRDAWHDQESARLAAYEIASASADAAVRRLSIVPRLWTALGTALVLVQVYLQTMSSFGTVALVGFVIIGAATLTNITTGMAQLMRALVSIRHLDLQPRQSFAMRSTAPLHPASLPAISDQATRDGSELRVQGLRYSYPTAAQPVIRDVDLSVTQGEKILLSGNSGSGKSTIGALLSGRLPATGGTIISHGVDRHVVGSRGWLRHVCYVPQSSDNHVLTDTFAFNLLLGRQWPPTASDLAEARELAIALGLGPLLEKMPAGMMQMVGEGGWRLSQGERSRLFVARGILQNAHVLIADELLSPLDPASGLEVLTAIERLPNQLILIAHT